MTTGNYDSDGNATNPRNAPTTAHHPAPARGRSAEAATAYWTGLYADAELGTTGETTAAAS